MSVCGISTHSVQASTAAAAEQALPLRRALATLRKAMLGLQRSPCPPPSLCRLVQTAQGEVLRTCGCWMSAAATGTAHGLVAEGAAVL